jgi:hypothetical protein
MARTHTRPFARRTFSAFAISETLSAPYILENVTGRSTISTRSGDVPHILSVGSFIHTATLHSVVWGTGLIHPSAGVGNPDPGRILAVRGKLTHAELLRNGIGVADVPLGDPGFLIPRLLQQKGSPAPRFPLGLVPHVFDRDHPFFVEAARYPGVKVLDVCDPAEVFFADMMSCDAIASSSLHGLIFGEALGLPTLWLEVSDKVLGEGFKFADWFSLARNPQPAPLRPDSYVSIDEIVDRCEPRELDIDASALLRVLTPDVIEECSRDPQTRRTLIPVSACRRRPLPVFIVADDGAEHIERMILWLRRQHRPIEIVVLYDNIVEPGTIALLDELKREGIVAHQLANDGAGDLTDRLNDVVTRFFEDWAEPSRYAVTGCSVDLGRVSPSATELYDDLLDRFPGADSVGPDIDRVGSGEPPAQLVVNGRAKHPEVAPANIVAPHRCILLKGGFDLSFLVYRAGKPLPHATASLRVRDPH